MKRSEFLAGLGAALFSGPKLLDFLGKDSQWKLGPARYVGKIPIRKDVEVIQNFVAYEQVGITIINPMGVYRFKAEDLI